MHCSTAIQWVCKNSAFPNREAFYRMSSKSSPTDRQSSEPSSPTMMNLWAKRQVCICLPPEIMSLSVHVEVCKGFFMGKLVAINILFLKSFNWIKPIIYMHQSSTKLSFLRHTLHNNTGTCCFNSLVSQHLVWCSPSYQDDVLKMNLFEHWDISFWHSLMQDFFCCCWKCCHFVCKERQLQTVMSSLIFEYIQCCIVRSLYACLVVKFLKM